MKKLSFLLLLSFMMFGGSILFAQNSGNIIYSDTIKVNLDQIKSPVGGKLLIGKIKAFDPENHSLNYKITTIYNKPLFSIDKFEGLLYVNTKYLDYLCETGSFSVKVLVSDEEFSSAANIRVFFECSK